MNKTTELYKLRYLTSKTLPNVYKDLDNAVAKLGKEWDGVLTVAVYYRAPPDDFADIRDCITNSFNVTSSRRDKLLKVVNELEKKYGSKLTSV